MRRAAMGLSGAAAAAPPRCMTGAEGARAVLTWLTTGAHGRRAAGPWELGALRAPASFPRRTQGRAARQLVKGCMG